MKNFKKKSFPVADVRRFLEPGPIVLVSSAWKDELNIMTMGWHTILAFEPSLIGCYIWDANYSHNLIKKSRECVINIPTIDLIEKTVAVGNCSGSEIDKFAEFDLTPEKAKKVDAPLIKECYANFECKLYESKFIKSFNFFIWEVVYAHVAVSPKLPKTFHYRGDGEFMISGETISLKNQFKPENL